VEVVFTAEIVEILPQRKGSFIPQRKQSAIIAEIAEVFIAERTEGEFFIGERTRRK
jgi:hypothetical protein